MCVNCKSIICLKNNYEIKTLQEIKHTGLDSCYLVIYTIETTINYHNDNTILSKNLYILIGLNASGKKRFIGSYIEDKSNNRFWLDVFEAFKKRGINDILFMCINGNHNFTRCIKASFPNVIIVPSITSIVDKFYNFFPDKFSTKIKDEIKALFLQDRVLDFENIFTFFNEKYNSNVILEKLTIKYLSNIDNLYKYDLNIRDVLFNTYRISILKRKFINISTGYGYIENIDELLELLLPELNALENFTSYHKKEWLNILSGFYTFRNKELEDLI